jgi:hypothetical protein
LIDLWHFRQLCPFEFLRTISIIHQFVSQSMTNNVTAVRAAPQELAVRHFEAQFTFETAGTRTRPSAAVTQALCSWRCEAPHCSRRGHVAGAINLPHGKIVASKMATYAPGTHVVTYCNGPHCNGAARGASHDSAIR